MIARIWKNRSIKIIWTFEKHVNRKETFSEYFVLTLTSCLSKFYYTTNEKNTEWKQFKQKKKGHWTNKQEC